MVTPALTAAQARYWQCPPTLDGRHVRLLPMQSGHTAALRRLLEEERFDDPWYTTVPGVGQIAAYVEAALRAQCAGQALPFLVIDADGNTVGATRYYALSAEVPRLNIGYTWYAPRVRGTLLNTEAKLLLLQHAFERMGCIRVAFETSTHNARSRAAIARLGALQEGILRNHKRHADGSRRDTALYAIIDDDWPRVKRRLQARLEMA